MRGFLRVHLVNGTNVDGTVNPFTQEESDDLKNYLGGVMGNENWQVNAVIPTGWAVFPARSVLYVELVEVK